MAIRLPCRSCDALDRRILRHAEHPADRPAADLGEDQLGHLVDVGPGLHDPVVAGQSGVEHAVLDIAGHLLGADQQALDLVVVDRGVIAPRAEGDLVAGPAEQFGRSPPGGCRRESPVSAAVAHGLGKACHFFVDLRPGRRPAGRRPSTRRASLGGRSNSCSRRGRRPRRSAGPTAGSCRDRNRGRPPGPAERCRSPRLSAKLVAAAAVVDGPAGGQGLGVAFGVHVGHHQDFAGLGVLGDGGEEPPPLAKSGAFWDCFGRLGHGLGFAALGS